MKKSYLKYFIALLLFGSNGVVASFIALSSHEIVLLRSVLGSIFLLALFFISGRRFTAHGNKRDLFFIALSGVAMGVNWLLLFATLVIVVYTGVKQGFVIDITSKNILPILWIGLLNTGVGCYFYFSSIGKLPIQSVAICGYIEPVSAVFFSAIFLHETMLPLQIVGAVLIIGGAIFAESHAAHAVAQPHESKA